MPRDQARVSSLPSDPQIRELLQRHYASLTGVSQAAFDLKIQVEIINEQARPVPNAVQMVLLPIDAACLGLWGYTFPDRCVSDCRISVIATDTESGAEYRIPDSLGHAEGELRGFMGFRLLRWSLVKEKTKERAKESALHGLMHDLGDDLARLSEGIVPSPEVTPTQPVAATRIGDRFAVIVGLSEYEHAGEHGLTNLTFADSDARSFAKELQKRGWSRSQVKLLLNDQATKLDVENSIRYGPDLKDSLIVVFWSGHGYPDPIDQEKLFLACYDTDMNKPGSGLRMSDVRSWLEERNAHNVVILADACHAGGLALGRGLQVESRFKPGSVPKGWLYLLGARIDEKALEHPALRGGLFTSSLVEAIEGAADGFGMLGCKDGVVTMAEIKEYVQAKMKEKAFQLHLDGSFEIEAHANTADKDIWELTLDSSR